mgnify:CR=1 FL=1
MNMEWIYSQYFSITSASLNFFSISFVREYYSSHRKWYVLIIFIISFSLAFISLWEIFGVYDSVESILLLMSSKCEVLNKHISCDISLQQTHKLFSCAVIFALFSFFMLIIGYIFDLGNRNANKNEDY